MKIPLQTVPILLAAGLLSCATASAGTFTTDFSTTTGFVPGGGAFVDTNRAILTPPAGNQSGSITISDLDGGQPIESFTANFKLQLGPGSGNAADGVSFSFGPDNYEGLVSSEEGPGGTALSVCFDPYDNGIGAEGTPTPSVDIRFQGALIASHAYTKAEMVTSQLEDVSVQLTRNGRITVSYKGQVIHNNVFVPGWAPTAGLFNFSGRTGGEFEEQDVAALNITTVLIGTPTAPTITANPQSATVSEGGSTNFSVAVDGTAPFSFQWVKNNFDILDATNTTLTLGPISYGDNNAKIKVRVTNPANTATSAEATLTVIKDTTPPTVVKANADVTGTQVTVVFSEPVTDTALTASNYGIDQGIGILGVTRVDATRVVLATSAMPGGRSFVLSVHGVQDTAFTPNTIVAVQVPFRSYLFQTGTVLHKKYNNVDDGTGSSVLNLFTDPRYPNLADRQDLMTTWEYPANGNVRDSTADPVRDYFDSLEGYFMPAVTGDYVFYVAGADRVWVYLSTDADPVNKKLIAQVSGWTNPREWMIPQGTTTTNGLRSDYFQGSEWPVVDGNGLYQISLQAGQRYYMETVHHDPSWSGADDFGVTFTLTNQAVPTAGSAPALTGSLVGTYLDPTGASVTFAQQPTNAVILQGRKATFTAAATGQSAYGTNVSYQWQTAPNGSSTFTNLPGEMTAKYTTPALGLADSGRKYQLLATVPGLTEASGIATVTVNADTIAPSLVAASALPSRTGATFDVGITFDEPLDATSAATSGNYSVSAGAISAVKYYAASPGVVLTVSGLAVGASYNVTVTNVGDPYGNHMAPSTRQFTVSGLHWDVVGGDELQLGNGVVAVGTNAFDVYSDGVGEWAAYDETTFVYEQITGDFDKEVRVEFQDSSSQWARAGLIVRDVPNFGVDRAAQEGGQAGRYQKVHVNPVVTAMGTPGNNLWEGNRRLDTGGASSSALTGPNSNPKYPNA